MAATFALALLRLAPAYAAESQDPLAVQEYTRSYGVDEAVADRRLEMQAKAPGIVNALEGRLGEDFAGVWFDNTEGRFVVPVVAGTDRAAIAKQFAEYGIGTDGYRIALVDSTVAELKKAEALVAESVKGLLAEGRATVGLDTSLNSVVVEIASNAGAGQRADLRAGAAAVPAKVTIVEVDPKGLEAEPQGCTWNYSLRACDPPFHGGVEIHGPTTCTSGFAATGNAQGNSFVITAGHCLLSTSPFYAETASGYENELGREEGHFYGGGNADGGLIRVKNNNWWVEKWGWRGHLVIWGSTPEFGAANPSDPIYGSASSYVGEYVCHSGRTTGTGCGTVTQLNAKVTYTDGTSLSHMTKTEGACGAPGDSGGPVYDASYPNYGVGIWSGGSGCGADYYTEVKEVESIYGVHVTTW